MAISSPQKRPMSRRDCYATIAMTAWQKLGTRESQGLTGDQLRIPTVSRERARRPR